MVAWYTHLMHRKDSRCVCVTQPRNRATAELQTLVHLHIE